MFNFRIVLSNHVLFGIIICNIFCKILEISLYRALSLSGPSRSGTSLLLEPYLVHQLGSLQNFSKLTFFHLAMSGTCFGHCIQDLHPDSKVFHSVVRGPPIQFRVVS